MVALFRACNSYVITELVFMNFGHTEFHCKFPTCPSCL